MPKRVRKRFNPLKHSTFKANQALKHYAVVYYTGTPHCLLVDLRTNKPTLMNQTTFDYISNLRHTWTVFIGSFARDNEDKPYIKPKEFESQEPYFQHELVDFLNTEHQELIKQSNQAQMFGAGWIATPFHKVWNEKEAFQLFEQLGAFNYRRIDADTIEEIK